MHTSVSERTLQKDGEADVTSLNVLTGDRMIARLAWPQGTVRIRESWADGVTVDHCSAARRSDDCVVCTVCLMRL